MEWFYWLNFSYEGNSAEKNALICAYHVVVVTKTLEEEEYCSAQERGREERRGGMRLQ